MKKNEIKTRRTALVNAHRATRSPAETLAALAAEIGTTAAVLAVAEAVNAAGAWDERISRRSREWATAEACSEEQSREGQAARYLYYPDAIHPAHMEQLARAAMEMQQAAEQAAEHAAEQAAEQAAAPRAPKSSKSCPRVVLFRESETGGHAYNEDAVQLDTLAVVVYDGARRVRADYMTAAARPATAVRRFFKALQQVRGLDCVKSLQAEAERLAATRGGDWTDDDARQHISLHDVGGAWILMADCFPAVPSDADTAILQALQHPHRASVDRAMQTAREAVHGFKEAAETAPALHISLSNEKLGNIENWNLTPGLTCSGAACRTCLHDGCYACESYKGYAHSSCWTWDANTALVRYNLPAWEQQMSAHFDALTAPRFFRIHSAGDFYNVPYLLAWVRIAAAHPHTAFLAFTKQFDVLRTACELLAWELPENLRIRLSDWPGTTVPADLAERFPVAWMDDGTRPADIFPAGALECPGNCETCGACWNLSCDTIFHKHGAAALRGIPEDVRA